MRPAVYVRRRPVMFGFSLCIICPLTWHRYNFFDRIRISVDPEVVVILPCELKPAFAFKLAHKSSFGWVGFKAYKIHVSICA